MTPYLSEYGLQLYDKLQQASIIEVLDAYPGLTWSQLAKPQYPTPESIPVYVQDANQLIMGSHATPSVPLFIGQGAGGELEGTPGNKPGIGRGDGVMIAGDVRSLAREYCGRGVPVQYVEYESLSHVLSAAPWLLEATSWLTDRFAGVPAPQDCWSIAPGNSLAPISVVSGLPSGSVSGALMDKKTGEPITLPTGSTFNGAINVNAETGKGSASGKLSIPAFSTSVQFFGLLPVIFGMNISQVGAIEGSVAPSTTVPGDETMQLPAKLGVDITSVSLLGLKIPTNCATAEPISLNLGGTATREELLKTAVGGRRQQHAVELQVRRRVARLRGWRRAQRPALRSGKPLLAEYQGAGRLIALAPFLVAPGAVSA